MILQIVDQSSKPLRSGRLVQAVVALPKIEESVGRHGNDVVNASMPNLVEIARRRQELGPVLLTIRVVKTGNMAVNRVDHPSQEFAAVVLPVVP